MFKTLSAAFFLVILLVSSATAGQIVEGVVRAVYDGDTILLATLRSTRLKVRLYGMDAPETSKPDKPGQPYGSNAKRALMYKIMGRRVQAEIMDVDKYKRTVAVIRNNGRDINREMVTEGFAWAYHQYLQGPYTSEYISAEQQARSRRAGLWSDANPLPPWEFRQRQKKHQGRKRFRW